MTPLQNESDNENWQMLIKKTQKQTEGATCSNTQDATHEALKPENKKKTRQMSEPLYEEKALEMQQGMNDNRHAKSKKYSLHLY